MTRKGDFTLTLCKGPCGRMTRDSGIKLADAPGTVSRAAYGKCKSCHQGNTRNLTAEPAKQGGGLQPCTGSCGRMTRNSRMPKEKFPGITVRTKGGMCWMCRREADPEYVAARLEKDRVRRAAKRPAPSTIPAASEALEKYLKERNKRLARRNAA